MHVQDNSCLNATDSDLFPDLTEFVKGPFVNSQDSWVETFHRQYLVYTWQYFNIAGLQRLCNGAIPHNIIIILSHIQEHNPRWLIWWAHQISNLMPLDRITWENAVEFYWTLHNRGVYGYAHEQASKGLWGQEGGKKWGGLEREKNKPLFLFPFSPPLPLPLFVPAMQVIDKVRCNGTIDV